jgi:hypothetical protein
MKKLLTTTLLTLSLLFVFGHTLTRNCWSNNQYSIRATQGNNNGKIEVTTYTNSSMTVLVEATKTYLLNNSGAVNFNVLQSVRTTTVFVYVRWFYKQGNNYFPVSWNSGQGYANSYSSVITGTNQCTAVAIEEYNITTQQTNNELHVVFTTTNYDKAYLQCSKDGTKFNEWQIFNNKAMFLLEEGTTFVRIKYIKGGKIIYSNTVSVTFTEYSINFAKPYKLFIYNSAGQLVKELNNNNQYILNLKGVYYLKYTQVKNNVLLQYVTKINNI